MSGRLLIEHEGETLEFAQKELQVAIALTDEGTLVFAADAEQRPVAWLGESNGKVFIQCVDEAVVVELNDARVVKSAWLHEGDCLDMSRTRYEITGERGDIRLKRLQTVQPTSDAATDPSVLVPRGPIEPIKRHRARGLKVSVVAFGLLVAAVAFLVVASPIRVVASPEPDSISVSGGYFPAIPVLGRFLAVPGKYTVRAQKKGYQTAEQSVQLASDAESVVTFKLQELPGYVTVLSKPVESANVYFDGRLAGQTPLRSFALMAGSHQLRVAVAGHRSMERGIQISGKGDAQTEEVALEPAAGAAVVYVSEPPAAELRINGGKVGLTPLQVETPIGVNRIELRKDGWKPLMREIEVKSETVARLPVLKLERAESQKSARQERATASVPEKKLALNELKRQSPEPAALPPVISPLAAISPEKTAQAILTITTTPVGANLVVDGEPRGNSPASLSLAGMREYVVSAEAPGIEKAIRKIRLEAGERKTFHIDIAGQYGIVFLNTRPAGAQLAVDGTPMGPASQRLRLTVEQHRLEITKPGYVPHTMTITPNADISKSIEINLQRAQDSTSPGRGAS